MKTFNSNGETRYSVYFGDISDERFVKMINHCKKNKLSLIKNESHNMDVSDVSGCYDTIAVFKFLEESDATFFKLAWV